MEQLEDDLLFRWRMALSMDAPAWEASTFPGNPDRLAASKEPQAIPAAMVVKPPAQAPMLGEGFSAHDPPIEVRAGEESFRPSAEEVGSGRHYAVCGSCNADGQGRAERRNNEAHPPARARSLSGPSKPAAVHLRPRPHPLHMEGSLDAGDEVQGSGRAGPLNDASPQLELDRLICGGVGDAALTTIRPA
jgi:hypothetical protein